MPIRKTCTICIRSVINDCIRQTIVENVKVACLRGMLGNMLANLIQVLPEAILHIHVKVEQAWEAVNWRSVTIFTFSIIYSRSYVIFITIMSFNCQILYILLSRLLLLYICICIFTSSIHMSLILSFRNLCCACDKLLTNNFFS